MLLPTTTIPEPLRANEAGTFTEDSVVRRLPEIARRTIAENHLDAAHANAVEALAVEIGDGTVTRIDEPAAADADDWDSYVTPHLGMSWLDAPWFFIETYFYRRLLAATGYSQPGDRRGVDPFLHQKQIALDGALELAAQLAEIIEDTRTLLGASLWANRVDLSLWPAGEDAASARTDAVLGGRQSHLLVDNSETAAEVLNQPAVNVHLVLDNSGAELVADLALVAYVLGRRGRVTLHAKSHPTFVSDVTVPDLDETIRRLSDEPTQARDIAEVISAGLTNGSLQVTTDPFWVSPGAGWTCPDHLSTQLGAADLIVMKGDANYRRLLGDAHWDPTTPFADIVRPPSPLVALRTSKALVIAGIDPSVAAHAASTDPDWMTSGEWGLIQYAPPAT
ncbi:MAG: protein-glutamate O-methyltransferase family protein [bacterium]|nr:protein-glutamate O-methyltransferase family protein [bacterium]